MTSILPDFPSNYDFDDEYSFAMEYTGPPLTSTIPRIGPIDVYRIPTAVLALDSTLTQHPLPIIQPILKSDPHLNKLELGNVVFRSEPVNQQIPKVTKSKVSSGTVSFGNYSNPANSDSNDSGSSSPALSSRVSTCGGEDCIEEVHSHWNGTTNSASIGADSEESDDEEMELTEIRTKARSVKKGLCHRCRKGSRFTEKEICIVCSAKYCSGCVLRAMGSMPEGRKCITCIGYPIDESNRSTLGKCTRMLKHLLSDFGIKQVMDFEISCELNQIPPHLVCINGRPLRVHEMTLLQQCKNPPKKLKPGKYWYDKVSGLWGKEGEKPSQIISPQLAIGNPISKDASNGNTNVLINGRKITKAELWMLQSAGVHCEGNPHFWVSADGSYQEEGQKNIKGNIWDKDITKLVCAVLSLPFRSASVNSDGEEIENSDNKHVVNERSKHKELHKFLLVGYDQSGTSTIFKQAKILYNSPFSEDERRNVKSMIQSNMYGYLGILLNGRERFEEEYLKETRQKHMNEPSTSANPDQTEETSPYSISPRLKAFSDWLLQVMMTGNLDAIFPAATREYAPRVEELWKDNAFQATYSRRNELSMLPRVANYFLDRAVEIARADYEPSDMDILYADGITSFNGLSSMEFSFSRPHHFSFTGPVDQTVPLQSYQLIRVHSSSLGEKCKWSNMFEDVDLILYCVALTDYDQLFYDNHGFATNKMILAKKLFETIITHPPFDKKYFLLILNKFDLLEEKIEHVPLTRCDWFNDFNPVITSNGVASLAQSASHYIGAKFKKFFNSVNSVDGRKLFVSVVTGLECDSVGEALSYGREIIHWDEERKDFNKEFSSGSTEEITTTSSIIPVQNGS